MISDTLSDAHSEILRYLRDSLDEEIGEFSKDELLARSLARIDGVEEDDLTEDQLKQAERGYDFRLKGRLVALLAEMDAVRDILDTPPSFALPSRGIQ